MKTPNTDILTCYVVDDEKHSVEATSDYILKTDGLQLIGSATNPLRAIDAVAKAGGPDLTFLDVNMPEMSGITFAERARAYTTIIFTTADPHQLDDFFADETFECLAKPFNYKQFSDCITRIRNK